ncbi:type I restriction-modification system subunit M [Mycobacterium sp. SMC-16]|uniref:class I SAM-dependent DNA methyltransferase n=1 Tax=Mycobacteriaceae TaxID=1762 RepID=UPI001CFA17AF|nr:class I SAM-dependent DNA methyltransferase [Mycolicibacterium phocaicum]UCZ60140.1 type I restriction-modification system subunit M [Mycolicibacterium phocaicum]
MAKVKAKAADAPSTSKELKDTLWKAADKLRGSMDASQYRDVVLGLVFLKYVSDAFDERRGELAAELAGEPEDFISETLEERDEYTGSGVFWVPRECRWEYLAKHAKGIPASASNDAQSIGNLIDEAMRGLMDANESLRGVLPTMYGRDNVDQRRLGELLDLFNSARFAGGGASKARDLLGEVYEYFLDKFAKAEGKRGGEFYTPQSIVRTLVEILEPHSGRVYDPCCGSGGMFVQAEKFLERHREDPTNIAVYGQEFNERTWRMAKMNLAIHGIDTAGLGTVWQDTFARDIHPDIKADYVLANPPFNIKDWVRREDDPRWRYGVPPARNANYAWMQHILSKLTAHGEAGVVMANGTMTSNTGGEGEIRKAMVEGDVVSCILALPGQLFRGTQIPACVWFFAKDKSAGKAGKTDRSRQVLFIDASELGYMVDRVERAFSNGEKGDIQRIANTFRAWRGRESAIDVYHDVPGFCKTATLDEIKAAGFALTPGRYVGAAEGEVDGEPIDEKIARLTKELTTALDESARLDAVVREQLKRIAQ